MKRSLGIILILVLAIVTWNSCNRPDAFGADILPDNEAGNIVYTDTVTLQSLTVPEEDVTTFQPNFTQGTYLVGTVDDAVFGKYSSAVYTQFRILTVPDFSDSELDSLVLTMVYDSIGRYGDISQPQTYTVYEMQTVIPADTTLVHTDDLPIDPTSVGNITFTPSPTPFVLDGRGNFRLPTVSVRLDDALGDRLMDPANTDNYLRNDQALDDPTAPYFLELFPGLYIEPDTNTCTSMIRLNLFDLNSRLTLYYTQGDTAELTYDYFINDDAVRQSRFFHNYTTSEVAPFVNNAALSDSLIFVQSMAGFNGKIEFPHLSELGDIIVNKAELVMTVVEDPMPPVGIFDGSPQIIALEYNSDGELNLIEDVAISLNRLSNFTLFGGAPEAFTDGTTSGTQYIMNLSGHLQRIVDGDVVDPAIYISSFPKPEWANRNVIGGAGNTQYPMELRLTYTKLD